MEGIYELVVKEVKSKDGRAFKVVKVVGDHDRLIDGVFCKAVDDETRAAVLKNSVCKIKGNVSIDTQNFKYPKAFIRYIDEII